MEKILRECIEYYLAKGYTQEQIETEFAKLSAKEVIRIHDCILEEKVSKKSWAKQDFRLGGTFIYNRGFNG